MPKHENILMLDGLRGIAAIVVLIGHATATIDGATLFGMKKIAVWFFFMLSGFVIARAYEDRLNSGDSLRTFMIARIIRLHPMLVLGTLLGVLWFGGVLGTMTFDLRNSASVMAGLIGLPGPKVTFNWSRFPLNPPEWSLFLEFLMYFLFAILFRHLNNTRLLLIALFGFLMFMTTTLIADDQELPIHHLLFGAIATFSMGIYISRFIKTRSLARVPNSSFFLLAAIIVATAAIPAQFFQITTAVTISVVMPAIIVLAIRSDNRKHDQLYRWLGEISYPLYITHIIVVYLFAHLSKHFEVSLVVPACIVSMMFAWGCLVFYDLPVRRRLRDRFLP